MIDVAIIGAGDLGGALAHVLARRQIVRRIQLIDPSGQVAAGKALDITQTGPIEGFTTQVLGSTDIGRASGCEVVVLADGVTPQVEADALLTLTRVQAVAARAVVVVAGADGRSLVERGVLERQYSRNRLIGSAPGALSAAVRALVALQIDGSVRDVALRVIGVPPQHAFVSWEDATVAGSAVTRVLDEPTLRRLSARIGRLWPPGAHALAHAAADAVASLCGTSRQAVDCFVAPDNSMGQRARVVALPVRLGTAGVVRVELPPLSGAAKVALDTAMLL